MDSSDEDTFDESNATEDEEEIDEIFEEDEIDDDDNQSSMSLDQDEQNAADTVADHFMEDNWPPQNIPLTVTDKSNKKKPGIIFLSSIPLDSMSPQQSHSFRSLAKLAEFSYSQI